ncbi:MAG: hypothetical protein A3G25_12535 [Betaproteobacteria bacterium RIFCSPLOWO2_12_FULL_63_13]|nr:MAG: hypothetical protein A3H32_19305 [Betaproteobacteria bacterium RIFCSPLOWO2_02_FULL_63_19]OGA51159.1 MAG: hypothetical protein A3G25_12535 [Betaproteobacteria bacterium RIFCSPLOWO2_12_FULL_63_13]
MENHSGKSYGGGRQRAPCVEGCPAGIDIPRYIGYAALGKFGEAAAVVRERIPFPAVCGYVCYRPCEPECRRALWEAPVAINAIKRAAVEKDTGVWKERWGEAVAAATGKRVAVVGSGPAGLTAAYYLGKRCGHEVTVFEAQPKPGGQLRIGIPPNRLPREALDEEIAMITAHRVDVKCNQRVDDLDELKRAGYDAVFLAVGTCIARDLEIAGEDLPGVWKAVQFLKEANLGVEQNRRPTVGKRVAVIGAGNVAVDCARTALRLGAQDVRILYRRGRKEMPAYDFEMRAAEAEGVKVEFLTSPLRIERDGSALKLWLQRMQLGQADASGRAAVQPVPGSDYAIAADTIMAAIGQTPGVSDAWGLARGAEGTIAVADGSLKTSREGVFAGGDVVLGPLNVIKAIAQGRSAAQEIDRYLGGSGDIAEILAPEAGEEMDYHPDIHPQGKGCVSMSELPPESRARGFELAERGYSDGEATEEARRCVRCDLWSAKAAPEIWWRSRGLKPYWLGGSDRMGREKDRAKAREHTPYAPAYERAPYIPHEYSAKE